jgi:hypothetical protein
MKNLNGNVLTIFEGGSEISIQFPEKPLSISKIYDLIERARNQNTTVLSTQKDIKLSGSATFTI